MDIARTPSRSPFATTGKRSKRGSIVVAAVSLTLLASGAAAMWKSTAVAAPAVDRASAWIETVHRSDLVREVPVQGTLVPEHVQFLSAMSAARVAKIVAKPGTEVEADSVVVVLENAELDLALLDAERQAASAESSLIQLDVRTNAEMKLQESGLSELHTELTDAERHAGSADRLAGQGLMGDIEHKDAVTKAAGLAEKFASEDARHQVLQEGRGREIDAARAEVARLRQIATFRHQQIDALQVRAGIKGTVQEVPLENGQWVAIGTLLGKVAEPTHLKADVRVAEGSAKDVHKGLPVRFESPSGAYRGHIARVDPSVIGGNVRLEVAIDDALPPGARADQTVTGYVEIEKLDAVLHVARPAGVVEGASAGIFRLEADHVHADRIPARFGRASARDIEVTGGLAEGDEIVVSDTTAWQASDHVGLK